METNFNQPQRQSAIGVLVMFFDTLQLAARALWPIILVSVFKAKTIHLAYFGLGALAVVAIIAFIAYLKYLKFTFYIDDENDEFIINEGVFNKTKTTIQLHKIQQVNISQSLIQRVIGVYALDVDTAGSDKKEGNVKAISHNLALALKTKLLDNEGQKTNEEPTVLSDESTQSTEKPFLKINPVSLLKVGITSNYVKSIGLILTFFFTVMDNLQNIGKDDALEGGVKRFVAHNSVLYSVLLFVVVVFTIVFVINVGRTMIKYFDFTITRQKGSLVLFHGLISTKSTILKPEKVQIVKISQNYFQKKLNVLEIKIRQAISNGKEDSKSVIEIPGCNFIEKEKIMNLIFKKTPVKGTMIKPNFRKLVFSIFLIIALPLFGFYIFGKYIENAAFDYLNFAVFYAVFCLVILFFGFRNYRLFISDHHVIKQSGAWDIDHEIIEIGKIQAITTSQLFWHKSLNIGSLTLHTAGGNVTFHLGNYTMIKDYVNLWLYEIETSDRNWM